MLTAKYVRDRLAEMQESLDRRGSSYPIKELLELDDKAKVIRNEVQGLRAKRNKGSMEISEMKKSGEAGVGTKVAELADIKSRIDKLEADLIKYDERINELLWNMPNILDKSVPVGNPPEANKVLGNWGTCKDRNIGTHEEILEKLHLLDMERAAKVAGARFYYLKGDLVLLEQSLGRYALDFMAKKGYTPVLPPFMLRKKYYRSVAPLATFEDALYRAGESNEASAVKDIEHIEDELFMIGTSEHSLAAMHAEELLSVKDFPLRYAGISPCFRREAGAHGRDQKGIFRVHQFDKVEQFIYCRQEDEAKYFDELLTNSEEIWKSLEIPYQLILLCSGDTGHQMAKSVDLEGWFPGQKAYRELGTCSTARDWQSVRLDIRYDEGGERRYAYTLNNTAISMARTLACIVENYVNDDGTITVPEVLVPYMGKRKIG